MGIGLLWELVTGEGITTHKKTVKQEEEYGDMQSYLLKGTLHTSNIPYVR